MSESLLTNQPNASHGMLEENVILQTAVIFTLVQITRKTLIDRVCCVKVSCQLCYFQTGEVSAILVGKVGKEVSYLVRFNVQLNT